MRCGVSLCDLPDEILLRILSLTGAPRVQLCAAFRLGRLCVRLRALLKRHFLPTLTELSSDALYAVSLTDARAARSALHSVFASVRMLKTLNLSGFPTALLSARGVGALVRVAGHSLEEINFAHSRISDGIVAPFMRCPKLRRLLLPNCAITGSVFGTKERAAPIEELDLSWTHSLTPEGVTAVAQIDTLKSLSLKGCDVLDNDALDAFLHSDIRLSLESVSFAFCPLTNRSLLDFVRLTPALKELTLADNCGNIWPQGLYTQAGIEALRTNFPHLIINFTT